MNNMKNTEMKELNTILEQYKLSTLQSSACTYEDVHKRNVAMMGAFLTLGTEGGNVQNGNFLWNMLYDLYEDPDSYTARELGGIKCSADGLLSIKRIYRKHGLTEEMMAEYDTYRKVPIFFFPCETNGINSSRCFAFGDRIDHTLYDLKRYFALMRQGKNADTCKLASAYKQPKTSVWLKAMGSFEKLVDWLGVKGIFVNENYEVYDIEKCVFDDGKDQEAYIQGCCEQYEWVWSENYYNNLKTLIDRYMKKYC